MLRTTFSRLIYCGQYFPGLYIADNIFQVKIRLSKLRTILLIGNHLRDEEMCVDEQVVGESGLGGSTEEEHEPDRGRCDIDQDRGIKAHFKRRVNN